MPIKVHLLPVLDDNYIHIIEDESSNNCAVVDPALAGPVSDWIKEHGKKLTNILITHHHWDHIGGIPDLKAQHGCHVTAPEYDRDRIPGADRYITEGESLELFGESIEVKFAPGHTTGHILYYFKNSDLVFVGDTLFSMGCGRMFEGTPEQFHSALEWLRNLPDNTEIYCAHEYTAANGEFALSIEPGNSDLHKRMEQVKQLRANNTPTLPTTIDVEKLTNPFLRWDSEELLNHFGLGSDVPAHSVFAQTRKAKDNF